MKSKVSIIQCVNDLNLSSGGPSKTVTSLSSNLCKLGLDVKICSRIPKAFDFKSANLKKNSDISFLNFNQKKGAFYRPLINTYLLEELNLNFRNNKKTVLHDNGIWLPFNNTISNFSRRSSVPLVISPHGMLEPWSLKYNFFKKKFAWYLYQRKSLKAASVLHATSYKEADNLLKLNLNLPVAVIPNGVEQSIYEDIKKFDFLDSNKKFLNKTNFLYVGRIHPKKGLMNLLKVWHKIFKDNNKCKLMIAGYPELDYLEKLKNYVNKNNLNTNVKFLGPVEGDDLVNLYKNSDIFVLPTYSENFGIVVAEALSYGIPVITTTGTPWKVLEEYNCGWYIEPHLESLKKALQEAFEINKNDYLIKSKNAINLSKTFNWEKISESFLKLYLWTLGEINKPSIIVS